MPNLRFGEALFMIADEYPDHGAINAETLGGSPIKLHLYVADVDELAEHAVAEGASVVQPVADRFTALRSLSRRLDLFSSGTYVVLTS
jgi:PhnB protein